MHSARSGGWWLSTKYSIGRTFSPPFGGLPPSALAESDEQAAVWLQHYIRNLSERDLPMLGLDMSPLAARRFLTMLAHVHGGTLNVAHLTSSFGVREPAIRRHLELLVRASVVRLLAPWHENAGKRIVKSPKVYLADNGILHSLLGLRSHDAWLGYPRVGHSWQSFAMGQRIQAISIARLWEDLPRLN